MVQQVCLLVALTRETPTTMKQYQIYTQQHPFLMEKLGLALVCRHRLAWLTIMETHGLGVTIQRQQS